MFGHCTSFLSRSSRNPSYSFSSSSSSSVYSFSPVFSTLPRSSYFTYERASPCSFQYIPLLRRYNTSSDSKQKLDKVTVIGSGNWGSVAARIVGQNVLKYPSLFEPQVNIWVFEEEMVASEQEIRATFHMIDKSGDGMSVRGVERLAREVMLDMTHVQATELFNLIDTKHDGKIDYEEFRNWWRSKELSGPTKKLTQIINRLNENIKYLPGVKLGSNIVAEPHLKTAVEGSTLLVFVTPHQFTRTICQQLKETVAATVNANKKGAVRAISLTKGMEITDDGFQLMSAMINKELGIDCSVLMGANIANEIAMERFSEATIGYEIPSNGEIFKTLFHTPYFHVRTVNDVPGPEMCGTLKNVVAIAAGMVDGLKLGNNSKAAIIRIGLLEMMKLSKLCFPSVKDGTFFESCGIADLITTCFGGRNRKCAEAFVVARGRKTFGELEAELLGGQKLQGVLTSDEVQHILEKMGKVEEFPLFTTINRIINNHLDPIQIVDYANLPKTREDMSDQAKAHE